MPNLNLIQGNNSQSLFGYNSVTTGIMGGCVSVIVVGLHGARAQHCAGGFQALDDLRIRNVGPIRAIIVAAPFFSGNDFGRVQAWVAQHRGSARTHYARGGNVRVNLDAVNQGQPLPSCVTFL